MQWNRPVFAHLVAFIFESAPGGVVYIRRYAEDLTVLAEIFHPAAVGFVGFELVLSVVIYSLHLCCAVHVHFVVLPFDRAFVIVGFGVVGECYHSMRRRR